MEEKFIIVECKSIEEGRKKGAEKLEVTEEKVKVEILEEGKRTLFGFKPFKIKVSKLEETEQEKETSLHKIIEKMETKIEEVEGDCGIYSFEPDGLYLTVFPPVGGAKVEFIQIMDEVSNFGFNLDDVHAISRAVEKPGEKVRIGPPQIKKILPKKALKFEESYVTYTLSEDGLYLTYHPPFGKELSFNQIYNQIYEELTKRGVKNLNLEALKSALVMKDESVKIAPLQTSEILQPGSIEVEISPDEMFATITIYPPFLGDPIDKDKLVESLMNAGIKVEIDKNLVDEAVDLAKTNKTTLRIQGIKPKPGQDAQIEYLFSTEKAKTGPEELEDGRVDYRELGIVENVSKGQVLVRKIPPSLGSPGLTVTGKEVPPLSGKDIPLPAGKGTVVSEDGLELLADIDGCPSIIGGKVQVLPIYEVKGDVNFSTGNIEFVGGVIVRGNVSSGFIVKAGGNVDIMGNVEDAIVESGGKVNIRGGVYGRGKALISAAEDITVKFVENVTLKSKQNIKIGESALHSNLIAGKKVIVSGKKGLIVGGKITAVEEVKAKTIGNYLATPTEIEVGINPEIREELKVLEKQIEINQDNLNKTQNAVEGLKQLQKQQDLPPAKKELLLKLTRTQFQLMAQLKSSVERKTKLEELSQQSVAAKVSASDRIYPGVKVSIKRAILLVSDELKFVTLFEKNDEVKVGTYR